MKVSKPLIQQLGLYAVVGAISMAIELSLLAFLISTLHMWYLIASPLVSLISLIFSFTFRKLWVFNNKATNVLGKQISFYILTLVGVVAFNTYLISILVEQFNVSPLPAQFFISLFSGFIGFLVNRSITFKENNEQKS